MVGRRLAEDLQKGDKTITIKRKDGIGDVIAEGHAGKLIAECKGWDKAHYRGTRNRFNECIGQALTTWDEKATPWVVFASNDWFKSQCHRAAALQRVKDARLSFAVVNDQGEVTEV